MKKTFYFLFSVWIILSSFSAFSLENNCLSPKSQSSEWQKDYTETFQFLSSLHQEHLLVTGWDLLSKEEQKERLNNLRTFNGQVENWDAACEEWSQWYQNVQKNILNSKLNVSINLNDLEPSVARPFGDADSIRKGNEILSKEKSPYAVLVVAGGSGSRFGHEEAKGTFARASSLSEKSYYQIIIEKNAAAAKAHGKETIYPVVFMLSEVTRESTLRYFKEQFQANPDFWNKNKSQICFVMQKVQPVCDAVGKAFLEDKTKINMQARGHGDVCELILNPHVKTSALEWNGEVKEFQARTDLQTWFDEKGVEFLQYSNVDNPLGPLADANFVGEHKKSRVEGKAESERRVHMTVGAVDKLSKDDKLAHIVRNSKTHELLTLEYTRLPDHLREVCKTGNPSIMIYTRWKHDTLPLEIGIPEKESQVALPEADFLARKNEFEKDKSFKIVRQEDGWVYFTIKSGIYKMEYSALEKARSSDSVEVNLPRDDTFAETKDRNDLYKAYRQTTNHWLTVLDRLYADTDPEMKELLKEFRIKAETQELYMELPFDADYASFDFLKSRLNSLSFKSFLKQALNENSHLWVSFENNEIRLISAQEFFTWELGLKLENQSKMDTAFIEKLADYVFGYNPQKIIENSEPQSVDVIPYSGVKAGFRDVVFFFKPECFFKDVFKEGKDFKGFFKEALNKLAQKGILVGGLKIINGSYLKEKNKVIVHYVAANRVALGESEISEIARQKAREKATEVNWGEVKGFFPYYQARDQINDYFGTEAISKDLNDDELEKLLWDDVDPNRPKGKGDASQYFRLVRIEHEGKEAVFAIFNGYVYKQALHFYKKGVIALNMKVPETGTEIRELRDIVGATDPLKATEGSLRNLFLQYFSNASMALNGTHFSAGWLEGSCENNNWFEQPGFLVEALVKKGVSREEINKVYNQLKLNPVVEFKGKKLPVFDHLEVQDFETNLELILSFCTFADHSSQAAA